MEKAIKLIGITVLAAVIGLSFTVCDNGTNGDPGGGHNHNWGSWVSTTLEGTEERVCKSDNTHIEHRLTGTARFTFQSATSSTYRVSKGTVTSGIVVIPAYYRMDVTSAWFPVTEIGSTGDGSLNNDYGYYSYGAFSDTGFIAVTIPQTVTSIGNKAFAGCTGLTAITIPASVTFIGNNAFAEGMMYYRLMALTTVTFEPGSAITSANFGSGAFPPDISRYNDFSGLGNYGDYLKRAYLAGGAGTYTRASDDGSWTKRRGEEGRKSTD